MCSWRATPPDGTCQSVPGVRATGRGACLDILRRSAYQGFVGEVDATKINLIPRPWQTLCRRAGTNAVGG